MIARMSKAEIIGPKTLLERVVSLVQEAGIFQVEVAQTVLADREIAAEGLKALLPDEKTARQRALFETLRREINELFSFLPSVSIRESYLDPESVLNDIAKTLDKHIAACRELHARREKTAGELEEFTRYGPFLDTLASLLSGVEETPDIDITGLTIKYSEAVPRLKDVLSALTGGRFELFTAPASDGTLAGFIMTGKEHSGKVKKMLSDERIPELDFPPSVKSLPLREKILFLKKKAAELSAELALIDAELKRFALRWGPIYKGVKQWLDTHLSALRATAYAIQSEMCFFLYGWMPAKDLGPLKQKLARQFGGKVLVVEREIKEEDLDKVPIIIQNPPYFRPFELFVRLLPLPQYTSYDPTPFIGIFFPIFFGMMVGDIGYGLVLLVAAFWLGRRFKAKGTLRDVSRILFICSIYAVFFGLLYGEFFGELGLRLFGLRAICVERRQAVIPMLFFALAVGFFHIMLGLMLGFISALRKKARRETLYRFFSLLLILGVTIAAASAFGILPRLLIRPMVIGMAVLVPLFVATGGFLAPLELLKSIGNIISYARIMAIGFTSVLLAFVANRLGGLTGNIATGIIVGGLLHALNIAISVFSPTIHSLRLHYVEFFGKFIEVGGRRFEPLKKT